MCESERASAFGSDGSGSEAAKNGNAGGSGESSESFGGIEGVDDRGEEPSGDHAWYQGFQENPQDDFCGRENICRSWKKTWHLCI